MNFLVWLRLCRAERVRDTVLLTHDGHILDLPPWHYGLRLRRE